jgi:tRNA(Glu) U13 pseudouridine synthase TruD
MTKKNVSVQNTDEKETLDYGFYSNVLKKPFERLEDLKQAEYVYFEEQKAKEDKAAQKKADAQKVEDAFKALNAARKVYKEDLIQLTKEYSDELDDLKKAFELGKKDIQDKLAEAEDSYADALKEFTATHPEGFHITLKDGDFETTISGSNKTNSSSEAMKTINDAFDIFRWGLGF